jgi:ABC-type lipoprotein release transport system permease subunit
MAKGAQLLRTVRLLFWSTVALWSDRTIWRLALRNVFRNVRRTAIVGVAIAVGVGGTLLTMGLNYGLMVQMVDTAIGTELGHVQVHAAGFDRNPGLDVRIRDAERLGGEVVGAAPGVRAWAPRVRSEALIFSPRASAGVALVAIDPEREAGVSSIASAMTRGHFLGRDERQLLLGEKLARRLGVDVGGKVVVSAQDVAGDMTGEAFRVGGLFQTSSTAVDEGVIYLGLDEAAAMLGLGDEISEWAVLAADRSLAGPVRDALEAGLGEGYEVKTWGELQPFLVYMIEMFESMGWIIYAVVFVAMTFGIANVLLMSVHERIREIGIVMAIGMRPSRVVAMVLAEGVVLSAVGLACGLIMTAGLLWLFRDGIDLSVWEAGLSAYGVGNRIIPLVRPADLVAPVVAVAVTAFVASLWPAIRAARIAPAEAVRRV